MNISGMFKVAAVVGGLATGVYVGLKAHSLFKESLKETEEHAKVMAGMWNDVLKDGLHEVAVATEEVNAMDAEFEEFAKNNPDAAAQWKFLRERSGQGPLPPTEQAACIKRFRARQGMRDSIRLNRQGKDNIVQGDFTKKKNTK